MTKVQTRFRLSRPLTEHDFESISKVHAVYGILAARVQGSGDELFVEYDFSRLSLKEVRGILAQNGIPIT
jgi:hypothetical protein